MTTHTWILICSSLVSGTWIAARILSGEFLWWKREDK